MVCIRASDGVLMLDSKDLTCFPFPSEQSSIGGSTVSLDMAVGKSKK